MTQSIIPFDVDTTNFSKSNCTQVSLLSMNWGQMIIISIDWFISRESKIINLANFFRG